MTTDTTTAMMVLDFDTTGRGEGRVAVPAGRYYLGDPCYPFSNDAAGNDAWMALLRSCGYFGATADGTPGPVGTVTVEDVTYSVLGFGTQYGDGGYRGSNGFEYPVDAGLIGLLPMALVDALGRMPGAPDADWLFGSGYKGEGAGTVYESTTGFLCERSSDGTLTFGTVVIETGDEEDEDDQCGTCAYSSCPGAYGGTCEEDEEE